MQPILFKNKGLYRSLWTDLSKDGIEGMTSLKSYPNNPEASLYVQKFATPHDNGMRYGQRVYGYFVPPESGNYIFGTSCTDECKLLLSKTDKEEKKEEIISRDAHG